jgi:hypothetical protein
MPQSNDMNFQNLSTVQGATQPKPNTIASAATVAPVGFLTFISGTVAIATITPPADGAHMLVFVFTTTTPTAFTTTGNIKAVTTPTQNIPMFLVYNPVEGKYYTGEVTA